MRVYYSWNNVFKSILATNIKKKNEDSNINDDYATIQLQQMLEEERIAYENNHAVTTNV